MTQHHRELVCEVLTALGELLPFTSDEHQRLVATELHHWLETARNRQANYSCKSSAKKCEINRTILYSAALFSRAFLDDVDMRQEVFHRISEVTGTDSAHKLQSYAAILADNTIQVVLQIARKAEMQIETASGPFIIRELVEVLRPLQDSLLYENNIPPQSGFFQVKQVLAVRHLFRIFSEFEATRAPLARFPWPFWLGIPDTSPLVLRHHRQDENYEFMIEPAWREQDACEDERTPARIIREQIEEMTTEDWLEMLSDHFEQDIRLLGMEALQK